MISTAVLSRRRSDPGQSPWVVLGSLPAFCVAVLLLLLSQAIFLESSLRVDLGLGRQGDTLSLANYIKVLNSSLFWTALRNSLWISLIATAVALLIAFPSAYIIARSRTALAEIVLDVVVSMSFITVAIHVLGLIVLFAPRGMLNSALVGLGFVSHPVQIVGTWPGVILGLVLSVVGFAILLLRALIETVPVSLEQAAMVHGSTRLGAVFRIVLMIIFPELVATGLTLFALCMGAFTSTVLLGGGKVLTLPVLIERSVLLNTQYGTGSAISAILLLVGLAIISSVSLMTSRSRRASRRVGP